MKRIVIIIIVFLLIVGNTVFAQVIKPGLDIDDKKVQFFGEHNEIKAIPIYRAYESDWGMHRYTTSKNIHDIWCQSLCSPDGIAGYISPVPLPYSVPMWIMEKLTEQYFVASEADRDYVIGKHGYADRGIMGYVVPLNDKVHGDSELHQWYKGDVDEVEDFGPWNADHYYHNSVYYIGGDYAYEGPQFRVWSGDTVLQEIDILMPTGGETLTGGKTTDIKWNTMIPGGKISLYYTLNSKNGWAVIAENLNNTGSYTWNVPNSKTDTAIIEARWSYDGIDGNCFDQSDKYFNVKLSPGQITEIDWRETFKPIDKDVLINPAAPTNLIAYCYAQKKQPTLYWTDNATNETGYVIERKTDGPFVILAQISANKNEYVDNDAEEGQIYYYRVKAIRGNTSSKYSNEASASVYSEKEEPEPEQDYETAQAIMLFTLDSSEYLVNGKADTLDVSPVIMNNRTLLPIRFIAEPIGAEVDWDGDERKVTIILETRKLELWIDNNTARVNGQSVLIDPDNSEVKPIIIGGRTMLPVRFVSENLGCIVEWAAESRQVKIMHQGILKDFDPQPEPPGKINYDIQGIGE